MRYSIVDIEMAVDQQNLSHVIGRELFYTERPLKRNSTSARTSTSVLARYAGINRIGIQSHAAKPNVITFGNVTALSSICYFMPLTRSSIATFRLFHTNSQTAITQATPIPPISTTKTPPTFARPSSFAAELLFEVSS